MSRRKRISKRNSRRMFRNTAKKVHKRNLRKVLHRGGYML